MKQAEYQARLDAADGNITKIAEAMGEQNADQDAALQVFVREELRALQNELLLLHSAVHQLRVAQANMIQVAVGSVELSVKSLTKRFDDYERLHDSLAGTLAVAVRAQSIQVADELVALRELIERMVKTS